jgi:hypothetical protein
MSLIVPSVIAASAFNALVNLNHPGAMRIEVADPIGFKFYPQLARSAQPPMSSQCQPSPGGLQCLSIAVPQGIGNREENLN